MDIHPIVVHFPIAFLVIYGFLETFRIPFLTRQNWYVPTKTIFSFIGTFGAFFALASGEGAEHNVASSLRPLINVHATFAVATTWVFGILALFCLITWIDRSAKQYIPSSVVRMWNALLVLKRVFYDSWFGVLAAVVGIVLVTFTGALGGAIVYGPSTDPVVSFVYYLFF